MMLTCHYMYFVTSYATFISLRVEKDNQVPCQLVQARSRVASIKNVTIPRLELLACTIGAQLAKIVKDDLRMENIDTFYWTDFNGCPSFDRN